jgi:hypothetical protein
VDDGSATATATGRRRGITEPGHLAAEREALVGFLQRQRDLVAWKVAGADDAALRAVATPTGLTAHGIVRHLENVERHWLRGVVAGEEDLAFDWTDEDPDGELHVPAGLPMVALLAAYADEARRCDAVVAATPLDGVSATGGYRLRWVLLHLVEETSRHLGHLDLLRELADGAVGEEPDGAAAGAPGTAAPPRAHQGHEARRVPRYLPFEAGPHRLRVGTRTLDPAAWVELGDDADAQLAEKRRLLQERHGEVVAVADADPGPGPVRAAGQELLDALVAHLLEHHPARYALRAGEVVDPRDGTGYLPRQRAGLHPVDLAARLVPEDLCLHLPGRDGVLRLVAASVAFPSRWVLAEKVGRAVGEVHAPVPGYAGAIGGPVDRVLERLEPARGLWRLNGSVLDDPALFQPRRPARVRPARVPDDVVLRVERQTLRRLPVSGAVVFTIRTHVDPLAALADDDAARARVAGWLQGLPGDLAAYKGLGELAPAVLAWLETGAATE